MKSMNLIAMSALVVLTLFATGCAPSLPSASNAQAFEMLQALKQSRQPVEARPALDLSNPIVCIVVEDDNLDLQQAIVDEFEALGIKVVSDPSLAEAGAVVTVAVNFIGNPKDAPENSQMKQLDRLATAGGTVHKAASVGLGLASPMSLVSTGLGLITRAASKAMEPERLTGQLTVRVRQNGKLWDVRVNQTVEADKEDQARQQLVKTLAKDTLKQLQG